MHRGGDLYGGKRGEVSFLSELYSDLLTVSAPAIARLSHPSVSSVHKRIERVELTHVHRSRRHSSMTLGNGFGSVLVHERPRHALSDFSCVLSSTSQEARLGIRAHLTKNTAFYTPDDLGSRRTRRAAACPPLRAMQPRRA